jgi:hypothetical protein
MGWMGYRSRVARASGRAVAVPPGAAVPPDPPLPPCRPGCPRVRCPRVRCPPSLPSARPPPLHAVSAAMDLSSGAALFVVVKGALLDKKVMKP